MRRLLFSLFITKGEVAVEPTSWSRIKAGPAR